LHMTLLERAAVGRLQCSQLELPAVNQARKVSLVWDAFSCFALSPCPRAEPCR